MGNTEPVLSRTKEVKIGKTTYQITSVFKGETELQTALENIVVKRILKQGMNLNA